MNDAQNDSKIRLQQAMDRQRELHEEPDRDEVPFESADIEALRIRKLVIPPAKPADTRTPEEKQADFEKWQAEQEQKRLDFERRQNLFRWNDLLREMGPRHTQKKLRDRVLYGTAEEQARQTAVFERVVDFGKNLKTHVESGRNLVLFGSRGTGKDFCVSNLLGMAVVFHGFHAGWQSGMRLYREFRESMRKDSRTTEQELIDSLCRHQVLVISDPLPPTGNLTPFQAETLLTVLDERYRFCRPTWITVNVSDRAEFETRMGALSVDRLLQDAEALYFNWPSFREHGPKTQEVQK